MIRFLSYIDLIALVLRETKRDMTGPEMWEYAHTTGWIHCVKIHHRPKTSADTEQPGAFRGILKRSWSDYKVTHKTGERKNPKTGRMVDTYVLTGKGTRVANAIDVPNAVKGMLRQSVFMFPELHGGDKAAPSLKKQEVRISAKDERAIHQLLEMAKLRTEAALKDGTDLFEVKKVLVHLDRMPSSPYTYKDRSRIVALNEPIHPYNYVTLPFVEWAASQGLWLHVYHDYDGNDRAKQYAVAISFLNQPPRALPVPRKRKRIRMKIPRRKPAQALVPVPRTRKTKQPALAALVPHELAAQYAPYVDLILMSLAVAQETGVSLRVTPNPDKKGLPQITYVE